MAEEFAVTEWQGSRKWVRRLKFPFLHKPTWALILLFVSLRTSQQATSRVCKPPEKGKKKGGNLLVSEDPDENSVV